MSAPTSPTSLRSRWAAWWPEILLFTFVAVLRISVVWAAASPSFTYDVDSHNRVMGWYADHWSMPDCGIAKVTMHPPLAHFLGGLLWRAHLSARVMTVAAALLRWIVVGWLVFRELPSRGARFIAIGLLAVIPASLHLDGLVSNEPVAVALWTAFLALSYRALREDDVRTKRWAQIGIAGGLALLSKISGLTLVACLGVYAVLATHHHRAQRRAIAFAFALILVLAGWLAARNVLLFEKPFVTTFDCVEKPIVAESNKLPYCKRRRMNFFVGFDGAAFNSPFYPSASSQLWPVLIASSFTDYYNYGFNRAATDKNGPRIINHRTVSEGSFQLARLSFVCGIGLTLIALFALLQRLVTAWRAHDWPGLYFWIAPIGAFVGLVHFATKYPIDRLGMVKGLYLQYAMVPMAFAVGHFVDAGRKAWRHAIVLLLLLGPTAYSIYCRIPFNHYP